MRSSAQCEPRTAVTDDDVSGFRVSIASPRDRRMVRLLRVWLVGWTIGELAALNWIVQVSYYLIGLRLGWIAEDPAVRLPYFRARPGEALFIAFVWFPFWTIFGVVAWRVLRWHLMGREVVAIHDGTIQLHREVGSRRCSRSFDLAGVRGLRYAPEPVTLSPAVALSPTQSLRAMLVLLGAEGGSIAFEHGGRTHRFGIRLSEEEAGRLIATLRDRFKIPEFRWEPLPVVR